MSPLATTKFSHEGEPLDSDRLVSDFQFQDSDLESLGACGGVDENQTVKTDESLDDFRVEGNILQKLLNMDKIEKPGMDSSQSTSAFGVIKDLSVSNIHIEEDDKTKHFTKKDFSNLSRSKPKVIERGNARLFAANTPGEDEKVFTLLSPESDFSESSSSEVWGYRPQLVHEPSLTETPETDSSIDACSYADLPNQNMYYKHGDSTNEASPVISEDKLTNLIGSVGDSPANQMSIVEMTENLLQMTLEMQEKIDSDLNTQLSAQLAADDGSVEAGSSHSDTQHASGDCSPPSGREDVISGEVTVINETQDLPTLDDEDGQDCEIVDLESPTALQETDTDVAMATEVDNSKTDSRETNVDDLVEDTSASETRSTFV